MSGFCQTIIIKIVIIFIMVSLVSACGGVEKNTQNIVADDGKKSVDDVEGGGIIKFNGEMPLLAKASGCSACHAIGKKIVGPAWSDIALRYSDDTSIIREELINKVKKGGKGNWTEITKGAPMPPYSPRVKDEDIAALVDFILSLDNSEDVDEYNPVSISELVSGGYECVSLSTNKGKIIIGLDKESAPESVSNFLGYTNSGFYDDTIFHRVIDQFMIQGGGYDDAFEKQQTNAPIVNEADNGLLNNRGTIAAARRASDPHSATAQFFINIVNNKFLDYRSKTTRGWGYAVFGEVVVGMDVVDSISKIKTGSGGEFPKDVPVENVVMGEVKVIACDTIE